jgi:glucan-binding YG repeat protein
MTKADIRANGFVRTLNNSIIRKILLVQANIESNRNGIYLHPIFNTHVSDEKRIVSYNLGMAVAKLYASELFNIPNLIHVETLKQQGAIDIDTTNNQKEPDLVGITSDGQWHVFEAKGMSSNNLNSKIIEAKNQAQKVNTIHGNIPATLNACATYFSPQKILSKIEDPKSLKEKDIKINYEKYFENYYNSFFLFDKKEVKKQRINNIDYNYFDVRTRKLNLSIGLENEIFELVQQKNFTYVNEYYARMKNIKKNFSSDFDITDNSTMEMTLSNSFSLGQDGFIVKYANFN